MPGFSATEMRITRLGDGGKPIEAEGFVVLPGGIEIDIDWHGDPPANASEYVIDRGAFAGGFTLVGEMVLTREGRRFFERLLLRRGGPWKAAHARRYPRGRRRR